MAAGCGETFIDPRIIGGIEAKELRYSWVVALVRKNGEFACSASLLTPLWIVTTAHCLQSVGTSDISVNIGSNEWNRASQVRKVQKIVTHQDYTETPTHHNDIGLVKLDSPIILDDTMFVICLPQSEESVHSRFYTTVGWGRTDQDYPTRLQEVDIMHRSEDHCAEWWGGEELFDSTIQICAGTSEGSCAGDLGSPLMARKLGRYVLAGLTSYGYDPCGTFLYPGVYTRLTAFLSWIKSILREDSRQLCYEGAVSNY